MFVCPPGPNLCDILQSMPLLMLCYHRRPKELENVSLQASVFQRKALINRSNFHKYLSQILNVC